MKKFQHLGIFICVSLLCIILFQFWFFISFVEIEKGEFRKTVIVEDVEQAYEIRLPRSEVFVDKAGLEWEENGREVLIYGVYHEVISVRYNGAEAFVMVIADNAENDLFRSYFKIHKTNNNGMDSFLTLILGLQFENLDFIPVCFNESASFRWCPEPGKDILYGHLIADLKPPLSFFS